MFHCLIIKDLCRSDSDQLIYFIIELFICQELFYFIFWSSFELPGNVLFPAVLSISNSFILSNSFAFVKNFFQVFLKQFFPTRGSHPAPNWGFSVSKELMRCSSRWQLSYNNTAAGKSQHLFSNFLIFRKIHTILCLYIIVWLFVLIPVHLNERKNFEPCSYEYLHI